VINFFTIFGAPSWRTDFYFNNTEDIIQYCKDYEKQNKNFSNYYPLGSFTSFGGSNLLEETLFIDVKKFILEQTTILHNDIGLEDNLSITSSWFNINRIYSYHESHHHIPHLYSGVYYLHCKDNDAKIIFQNKTVLESSWPYNCRKKFPTEFNTTDLIIQPTSGMLLIFPSYLLHKVEQQNVEQERISISFNIDAIHA